MFHVFESNGTLQGEFIDLYGSTTGGVWNWPAQGMLVQGFRSKGQVYVSQGVKRTANGFGSHLVAHELLDRDDPNHLNRPADWATWDQFFLREMDWLITTRPR